MLVAISGSQGSGKSTVLKALKEGYFGYRMVERKTSRSVLTEWGKTLEEVYSDCKLATKFQEEILQRKIEDEKEAVEDHHVWFTERTYADVFTYALIVMGKDNNYSNWLNDYYKQCCLAQQQFIHVYYLKAGQFQVQHDGVRGSNAHYQKMVDLIMFDLTKQMTLAKRLDVVETPILDQRVTIINNQVGETYVKGRW